MWFVRAALLHLALGFTLGALLLFHKGIPVVPAAWRLRPAHVAFLLVGWTIQLVMGVATWILPRFGVPRTRHGSSAVAWLAFALLNAGVWLVALGVPLAGRVVEVGAAAAFVANIWGRVRPSGLSEM